MPDPLGIPESLAFGVGKGVRLFKSVKSKLAEILNLNLEIPEFWPKYNNSTHAFKNLPLFTGFRMYFRSAGAKSVIRLAADRAGANQSVGK